MPPKNKKDDNKPKKVAIDKTFGMKNKKGAQAQKAIATIKSQAEQAQSPEQKKKAAEKAAAEAAKKEAAELFKPVQIQKVPFGVDPKTVLCQFFKKGACEKGKKCKFSHDLGVERKVEKRDLYADGRDEDKKDEKEKDKMDDWDEAKLREVVLSKHGNPKTTTDKVCKFFVEAVENGKYGWFWTCPNGGDKCMYKHSLPAGFVLKTKEQRAAEKALMDKSPLKTLTLEDFIETERQKLTGKLTPVTEESFAKWKKERVNKKQAEQEMLNAKEATGRAMFEAGDWKNDSDDDEDDDDGEDEFVRLRLETEEEQRRREEERVGGGIGLGKGVMGDVPDTNGDG